MTDGMAIIDHGAERKSIGHALRDFHQGLQLPGDGELVISSSGSGGLR